MIEGVRMRNAGSWMQHYRGCDGLTIRKIDVFNHVAYNNDGLNVDSCRNVTIEDCRVDSDDDGIVLKSLSLDPCRNVTIRRCTVSATATRSKWAPSRAAVSSTSRSPTAPSTRRGSPKIYGAARPGGIALEIVDGGTLRNVRVSSIRIDGVTAPVFLRLGNWARVYADGGAKPGVGVFARRRPPRHHRRERVGNRLLDHRPAGPSDQERGARKPQAPLTAAEPPSRQSGP